MSTENRNYHQEIHHLIENRPWAFGHLYPQKVFQFIFIILGFASFFYSIFASFRLYLLLETSKALTDSVDNSLELNLSNNVQQAIIEAIVDITLKLTT